MRKITFYIGLNDKDSKVQEVGTLEASKILSRILGEIGATFTDANGVYNHEDGTVVNEASVKAEVFDVDGNLNEGWIIDKTSEIKKILNQESVLVQIQDVNSNLY